MKTATVKQLNNIVTNNILNDPIYQRVARYIKNKLFLSIVEEDVTPSSPAIHVIYSEKKKPASIASLTSSRKRKSLNIENETQVTHLKINRLMHAMANHLPQEEAEDPSPLVMLGFLVKIARREQNLSIEDLAGMTNLDLETIFMIENGLAAMDLVSENLETVCDSLGLDYYQTSSYVIDLILK